MLVSRIAPSFDPPPTPSRMWEGASKKYKKKDIGGYAANILLFVFLNMGFSPDKRKPKNRDDS